MILRRLKICLIVSSCVSCVTLPELDIQVYKADSIQEAIVREQDGEIIYAREQRFDDYYCVSGDDLGEIYDALLRCRRCNED